jgi:plasmid stabilization system protein ParE
VSYWVHPQAADELGDAAVYYASEANLAIAEAFLAEFERGLELLVSNQQLGMHSEHGMRVYHFDRFPYTVVYEENLLLGPQVFAIAHQRREPGYWAERL